jgi:hypothetical protein
MTVYCLEKMYMASVRTAFSIIDDGYCDVSDGQSHFCLKVATYRIYDDDLERILGLVMRGVGSPPKFERTGLAEFEPGSVLDSWYEKNGTLMTVTII